MSRISSSDFLIFSSSVTLAAAIGSVACEASSDGDDAENPVQEGGAGGSFGDDGIDLGQLGSGGDVGEGGAENGVLEIAETLPEGFTANVSRDPLLRAFGGWKRIGPLDASHRVSGAACANVLRVVVRDLADAHPDFGGGGGDDHDIVQNLLGSDRKPVFAGSDRVQRFDEWYRNVEGVNLPFVVDLWLEPDDATFVFDSDSFFPLDGAGFPETHYGNDGKPHNFLFTTELHTRFRYGGGEVFSFRGDDDVFVFVDGSLVVNLGGIHGPQVGSVSLDDVAASLGLEVGESYALDLFQAERNPTGSNFRIETTLDFTGCSEIVPGDVVR